jgi:hypothetical protein
MFLIYVLFLIGIGIAMLVMAGVKSGQTAPSGGYAAAALAWRAGIALVGYLWSRATFSKRA